MALASGDLPDIRCDHHVASSTIPLRLHRRPTGLVYDAIACIGIYSPQNAIIESQTPLTLMSEGRCGEGSLALTYFLAR